MTWIIVSFICYGCWYLYNKESNKIFKNNPLLKSKPVSESNSYELNEIKVGIGGHGSTVDRIERHKRLSWVNYAVLELATGEEAYAIEEEILEWLRFDLHLPAYLVSEQMPQGGHTETVDASEIDLPTIWAKVEELSKVKR